ncbi:3-isopropylmalate dehydratase small subunit [Sabulicella glaciei]|uniref:3-isopropylmalate dehydratase small subunit n=1 Tax=Sabulicella glaciei TaxID=2984948 RepID=A0ABT3NR88_9PROT|nr:3-isopropylmalate dehydratase small subunit [Roseococcus sp. MDT2-1-1]MCW8084674.1 3-isopropylmalate dehydratase small subunit [Roseococcus sp. MDT2-1-1]
MTPFSSVTGPAAPLLAANVDTDVIIPIQALVGTGKDGLGEQAFARLRYRSDGTENPEFLLNQKSWRGTPILLAGENFGCGSSREGAVWALMGMGVRCVIAPSFGDIFHANCFQNGLLPVRLPMDAIRRIAALSGANGLTTVDLERGVVIAPDGEAIPFQVDPRKREALLEGLDDISLTLRHAEAIAAFRDRAQTERPWQ